ncbi:MAG: NAD(P)-dependent oxidoreductase [Clostridia bacterium]|nr:NAD(P)-dependent oxidoreductase [Clostridia bacterium]
MKKIGFIGTGVMGKSMVRNLQKAGYELSVYNRTREKAEELIKEGAVWCETPASCAKGKDAVITIVGYPKDVEEVYFGTDGVFEGADPGTYLIDMTTTSPQLSVKIYEEGKKRGLHVLDAPVSGGDIGAQNATLAIMVGAEETDFAACYDLLKAMGSSVIHEGPAGSGQHVKMANQIAIAGTVTGVCEAVAYTQAMGVDTDKMLKTITGGAAGSWQLANLGPKMAVGDYAPGFYIKHFIKDMRIAEEEAGEQNLVLPILEKVCEMFEKLEQNGKGENGTQGIMEYYKEGMEKE